MTLNDIKQLQPERIVISPGPGRPEEAGITLPLIQRFSGIIPILGICLGHQAIAQAFGARFVRAQKVMHGKTSLIHHHQNNLFGNLPKSITATRYHSLVIDKKSLPNDFDITAWTDEGEIMGIQHRYLPLTGLQFHPESILTEYGYQLLANFINKAMNTSPEEQCT